jgi:membrane protease YdiL (CAAX protease family)
LAADHSLVLFFTIAYAFSWLADLPMIFGRGPIGFWMPVMSFGPAIAAIITNRLVTGSYRAFRFDQNWPQTVMAAAFGIALVILAYVVLPAITTTSPRQLHWGIFASVGVYNYSTLLGGPLGEEPGWRGYALPRLEARMGPVYASAVLGMLWFGWHLPLFLIHGWTSSPLWIFMLMLLGLSFIMSFGANLSRFSVVTSIAMHAAFNSVSGLLNGLFAEVQPAVHISFELVLALSGLSAALLLVVLTKGRLGYGGDELL